MQPIDFLLTESFLWIAQKTLATLVALSLACLTLPITMSEEAKEGSEPITLRVRDQVGCWMCRNNGNALETCALHRRDTRIFGERVLDAFPLYLVSF